MELPPLDGIAELMSEMDQQLEEEQEKGAEEAAGEPGWGNMSWTSFVSSTDTVDIHMWS